MEEKKFPGAAKVLKAKADKYLNQAWELHEHEDMELMKKFLQRKMEEESCDALDLAAAMLKLQVGDKSEEIAVDEYVTRQKRQTDNRRSGRTEGRRTEGRRVEGRRTEGSRTEGSRTRNFGDRRRERTDRGKERNGRKK